MIFLKAPFIFSWKLLSRYLAQNFELFGSGQVGNVLKEVNSDPLPRRTSLFVSGKSMGYRGRLVEIGFPGKDWSIRWTIGVILPMELGCLHLFIG